MLRFDANVRRQFADKSSDFDDFERCLDAWEDRFREYEKVAQGEQTLGRKVGFLSARRLVAVQATYMASRVVNLGNAVVLLVNRPNVHAAPAVARALFETCAVAAYTKRQLVPLLAKGRVDRAHVLIFRLGLGTHASSDLSRVRVLQVASFVNALAAEAHDLITSVEGDSTGAPQFPGKSHAEVIRLMYSLLSEHTHPNQGAMALSQTDHPDGGAAWTLQPNFSDSMLAAAVRPAWLAMELGGRALAVVMHAADEHPMELPDRDPLFAPEDLN